jgi:anti-anti-sigma regulatory factor
MPFLDSEIVSSAGLEMRIEAGDEAKILYCEGQITCGETSEAFKAAIVELFHQHKNIIVDLGGIRRMDRIALATLVSLYPPARNAGSSVKYVNLTVDVSDARPAQNSVRTWN